MSTRPPRTVAALLAASCLLLATLLAPAVAAGRDRHHHRHPHGKAKRHHHHSRHTHRLVKPKVPRLDRTRAPAAPATQPAPEITRQRFGAFTDDAPYGGNVDAIETLQSTLRRRVDIVNWYQNWSTSPGVDWVSRVQPGVIGAVTASGRTPLLTWEPWKAGAGANQPQFTLRKIADGEFDAYISEWADGLRDTGQEIYLRPMHEMNGDWYPWGATINGNTPALYVAAWRRMHAIFVDHGATNVRWVWCPLPWSVPHTPENEIERYYPGTPYVDVLSLDGYNWGSVRPEYGGWKSFSEIFKDAYDRLAKLGPQPIWIAEVGSVPQGGDKAAWVRDMWRTASRWNRLKAIVWFDQDGLEDWSATTVASAFAE